MSYKLVRGSRECVTVEIGQYADVYCITHGRYIVECMWCGCEFHSKRPHTRYHSNACRQAAYRARKQEVANV